MLIIREAYFGAKLEMIEAATELSEELRNKGSYIRDGVTLEEVRKAATRSTINWLAALKMMHSSLTSTTS